RILTVAEHYTKQVTIGTRCREDQAVTGVPSETSLDAGDAGVGEGAEEQVRRLPVKARVSGRRRQYVAGRRDDLREERRLAGEDGEGKQIAGGGVVVGGVESLRVGKVGVVEAQEASLHVHQGNEGLL